VVAAGTRHEATVANVKRTNKTEKTIVTTTIKRIITIIIIITIVAIDDTIIEDVVLSNVVENRVKTEATATVTEVSTIFTNAGLSCLKTPPPSLRTEGTVFLRDVQSVPKIPRIFQHKPLVFRTDRYLDEDWRTGRKISICDSDDGRQTPKVSSHPTTYANTNSITPSAGYGNSQPGVLILPDVNHQSSPGNQSAVSSQQQGSGQQQRTLFDPNNPHKPIVIISPGSRAAASR